MGKRGPAPKPRAVAELDGSARHDPQRYRRGIDGKKLEGVPNPPARLDDVSRDYWLKLAPVAHQMGVLTEADIEAFADLCEAHARRDEAQRMIDEQGEVIEHHAKGKYRNPWGTVLREAHAQLKNLRSRFGLTPSDRTGIQAVGWSSTGASATGHWGSLDDD